MKKEMVAVLLDENNVKGVSYHRLYIPFKALERKGRNVKFFANLQDLQPYLQECRAVVTSRGFIPKLPYKQFAQAMHSFGIHIVLDQDDWWQLDRWHPMLHIFEGENKRQVIEESIKAADWVTVTHKKLAKKVWNIDKKKKILELPNCIDASLEQWSTEKSETDKVRFGYIAGATHERDLEEVGGIKFGAEGKEMVVADVMTYKDILDATKVLEPTDVHNYGKMYREFDVSIAPLKKTEFNKCKSNLKVLEAGFTKTAFIGSNMHPYTGIIKNGYNGILCSNEKEWREAIDGMTLEKARELGENLYKTVQEYEVNSINLIREKFFWG